MLVDSGRFNSFSLELVFGHVDSSGGNPPFLPANDQGNPRTCPPPKLRLPPSNKGLIAGLIKGNQWVFINPDHKAGYFLGGVARIPMK